MTKLIDNAVEVLVVKPLSQTPINPDKSRIGLLIVGLFAVITSVSAHILLSVTLGSLAALSLVLLGVLISDFIGSVMASLVTIAFVTITVMTITEFNTTS